MRITTAFRDEVVLVIEERLFKIKVIQTSWLAFKPASLSVRALLRAVDVVG